VVLATMKSGAQFRWRDGRPVAILFALTILLPALALALLAYRALDSDRKLAEQAARERLADAGLQGYERVEGCVEEVRARTEALGRGQRPSAAPKPGMAEVILSTELELAPAPLFAWVPDGRLKAGARPPAELLRAEEAEQRENAPREAADRYSSLLAKGAGPWAGWLELRRARAHAHAGEKVQSQAALRRASTLPDSPGSPPSSFAARFELSKGDAGEAARLYEALSRGRWLLEKSPYAFYEEQLRTRAGGYIPAERMHTEQERQAAARILERAVNGESGWLREGTSAALVLRASGSRPAATISLRPAWEACLQAAAQEAPADLTVRWGENPPGGSGLASAVSLSPLGLPWALWAEPRDPSAAARENRGRRLLLLSILILVAGVLAFGSVATVWVVRRELRVAQVQSDFAAAVSHEFRSPLTGIRQLAEMLLAGRGAQDEEKRRQYYALISQESERLTRLVENVLDFARIEDGRRDYRFEPIDTADWLREMAAIAARRRRIETGLAPGLPAIRGDREALSTAVLNLLDNAIKYSPEGTPVQLRARAENGCVCIEVEDQGCGIPKEEQARVFDRFYRGASAGQRTAKGVGLGLALVKRIAEAHSARLFLESQPGEGSTFTLSLRSFA
jgi:signal transduction histidine kinase